MGLFDGLMQAISGYATNVQNKELLMQSWQREDTAVQRRAADLRAAGFNPVLAAGAPAQTMSPISLRPPDMSGIDPMTIGAAAADISKTLTSTRLESLQADEKQWNLDWAKKWGIPTTFGQDQTTRIPQLLGSTLGAAGDKLLDAIIDASKNAGKEINKAGGLVPWIKQMWKQLTGKDQ